MKYTVPPLIFQIFKFIYKLDTAISQSNPDYEFYEEEVKLEMPDVDLNKVFYQINELLGKI